MKVFLISSNAHLSGLKNSSFCAKPIAVIIMADRLSKTIPREHDFFHSKKLIYNIIYILSTIIFYVGNFACFEQ